MACWLFRFVKEHRPWRFEAILEDINSLILSNHMVVFFFFTITKSHIRQVITKRNSLEATLKY